MSSASSSRVPVPPMVKFGDHAFRMGAVRCIVYELTGRGIPLSARVYMLDSIDQPVLILRGLDALKLCEYAAICGESHPSIRRTRSRKSTDGWTEVVDTFTDSIVSIRFDDENAWIVHRDGHAQTLPADWFRGWLQANAMEWDRDPADLAAYDRKVGRPTFTGDPTWDYSAYQARGGILNMDTWGSIASEYHDLSAKSAGTVLDPETGYTLGHLRSLLLVDRHPAPEPTPSGRLTGDVPRAADLSRMAENPGPDRLTMRDTTGDQPEISDDPARDPTGWLPKYD